MNGIEKITQRIGQDTQADIDRVLADARAEAAQITAKFQAQAEAEARDLAVKNEKAAAEREALARKYSFNHWADLEDGRSVVRFCTSWATREEDVDALVADIQNL